MEQHKQKMHLSWETVPKPLVALCEAQACIKGLIWALLSGQFWTMDLKRDARLWGKSRSFPDLGVSVTTLGSSPFLKTRNVCTERLWGRRDGRWAPAWEENTGYGLCAIFSDYPAYGRWSRFLHSPGHSQVSQKKLKKIVYAFNNWATLGGTQGSACILNYREKKKKKVVHNLIRLQTHQSIWEPWKASSTTRFAYSKFVSLFSFPCTSVRLEPSWEWNEQRWRTVRKTICVVNPAQPEAGSTRFIMGNPLVVRCFQPTSPGLSYLNAVCRPWFDRDAQRLPDLKCMKLISSLLNQGSVTVSDNPHWLRPAGKFPVSPGTV